MQKSEKVTELNIIGNEATVNSDMSVASVQFELLQRLADRVVRDAEELAARIRREAESEGARLIEDANRMAQGIVDKAQKQSEAAAAAEEKASAILQEAKQKAMTIETEAIRGVTESRRKVGEDIKKNLTEVLGKIQEDLRPSLDYLVERARTLEEEVEKDRVSNKTTSEAELPALTGSVYETINEPQSEPEKAKGSAKTTESGYSTEGRTCNAGALIAAEELVAAEKSLSKKDQELWEGKIEIDIAPPVIITRLLGVTRYLENTLDIKVLKTSGSSNSGIALIILLDKPLPLLNLLRLIPAIEEAKIAEDQKQSSNGEQSDGKKISVVLGRNAA